MFRTAMQATCIQDKDRARRERGLRHASKHPNRQRAKCGNGELCERQVAMQRRYRRGKSRQCARIKFHAAGI